MQINKDTSLYKILQEHPESAEIFSRFGMECARCLGASTESIEMSCKMHNVNMQELLGALRELIEPQQ